MKKKAKAKKPRVFVLGKREFAKLFKLASWVEDIPTWIDLGDHAWDQIETYWQETLQSQLTEDEIVRVEIRGAQLVAYVWPYEQGHKEQCIPIVERGTR